MQVIHGHLVVFNNDRDLELVHTVPDRHELAGTPDETVHLNGTHLLLESFHVRLVVPWLHVKGYNTLSWRARALRSLALLILLHTLSLDALSLRIDLVFVRAEQIDLVIITTSGSTEVQKLSRLRLVALEVGVLSLERLDVLLPARHIRELVAVHWRLDGLIHGHVSLRRLVTVFS